MAKKTFPDYTSGDEKAPDHFPFDVGEPGELPPKQPRASGEQAMRKGNETLADIRFRTQGGIEEKPAKNETKPFKLR